MLIALMAANSVSQAVCETYRAVMVTNLRSDILLISVLCVPIFASGVYMYIFPLLSFYCIFKYSIHFQHVNGYPSQVLTMAQVA